MPDADALVARGRAALDAGDWAAARSCFEAAGTGPPALDGLAQALFSLADYAGAIDRGEQAFAAYQACGEGVRAAMCARQVAFLYGAVHGNWAVARGWLGRAVRLVGETDCPERARIELTLANVATDPVARERHLVAATEIATRHGDSDLVWDARSMRGLQLVADGAVAEGMALLDEALAAVAAGEVRDLVSVGAMYCKMLHACELTCDVRRAQDWLLLAQRFVERTDRVPIGAICRTHFGGVLTAAGRWADAERELVDSVALYDGSYRALRSAALVRLAALRVRQGRLAEAGELLTGSEHDGYAARPTVELHLARDEPELATARAERFLRDEPAPELATSIMALLVRARLAVHDGAGAAAALQRLRERASTELDAALVAHAAGLVADGEAAVGPLEQAQARFARLGLPLEEARARLDLAGALAASRPEMAVAEARTALAAFRELAAARDADAAASLLRRLGVRGHAWSAGDGTLTAREREVLGLLGDGLSNVDIAGRLFLSRRTVEHHVSNVLAKLGLRTRGEAAAYAVRQGR